MADIVAYGNTTFAAAQGKLMTLLEALETTLAAGSGGDAYNPLYSNVYSNHTVANIALNAVTVALESCVTDMTAAGSTGAVVTYLMAFSVRVHTAYEDGHNNIANNMNLLNSVTNKLLNNQNLGDGYRILNVDQFSTNTTFSESATIGGQVIVNVGYRLTHTQE